MTKFTRLGAISLSLVLALSGLTGCQNNTTSSTSSSSTSTSSSSQTVQGMDLSGVTDPYLATAGLSGDTVVATVNGNEVTANWLLYWLSYAADSSYQYSTMMGMSEIPWDTESDGVTMEQSILNSALETAALYALLPSMAAQEGLTPSAEAEGYVTSNLASMLEKAGSQELLDHMMWSSAMDQSVYLGLFQVNDLNTQLQELWFGEGTDGDPTDQQLTEYATNDLGIAYRAKHILLKTVDTSKPITDENGAMTGEYEPLDEATVAEKKALAEDLLAQLQAAQDKETLFDSLMTQYTEDVDATGAPNSPEGYEAKLGQMVVPFEEAALALQPGEISGLVESTYGYHIILRLPLELDAYRSSYITQQMQDIQQGWLEEYPVETTEAYASIDPSDFYEKLTALRVTVDEEVAAQDAAQQEAADSSSSASSQS